MSKQNSLDTTVVFLSIFWRHQAQSSSLAPVDTRIRSPNLAWRPHNTGILTIDANLRREPW